MQLHDIITRSSSVNLSQSVKSSDLHDNVVKDLSFMGYAVHHWVVGSDVLNRQGSFAFNWLEVVPHLARSQCCNSVSVWQALLSQPHFIIQAPINRGWGKFISVPFVRQFHSSVRSAGKCKDLLTYIMLIFCPWFTVCVSYYKFNEWNKMVDIQQWQEHLYLILWPQKSILPTLLWYVGFINCRTQLSGSRCMLFIT